MRPDRRDFQSGFAGEVGQLAAKIEDVLARALNVGANLSPELDHRLMHLRLDLLFEQDFSALKDLLNVRFQFARLRIDNREFLLDSESIGVVLLRHWSNESLPKSATCHPEQSEGSH